MSKVRRIYFIKPVGLDGPIKIGYSAVPDQRLLSFSKWSPLPLELLVSVPGNAHLEQRIHEHFADAYSHHEWFVATPELRRLVADLIRGVPINDAIDLSQHKPSGRRLRGPSVFRMTEPDAEPQGTAA